MRVCHRNKLPIRRIQRDQIGMFGKLLKIVRRILSEGQSDSVNQIAPTSVIVHPSNKGIPDPRLAGNAAIVTIFGQN